MNKEILKKIIRESYEEVIKEKAKEKNQTPPPKKKEEPKKQSAEVPKKKAPPVKKTDLDQTKDDKINAGDAVVAAKKEKIALSKGEKKDAAFYKKIKSIVNKRIGSFA